MADLDNQGSGTEISSGQVESGGNPGAGADLNAAPQVVERTKPVFQPKTGSETPKPGVKPVENGSETPAPEYTPNYKFKVHNQEKEFDEWLRTSIKDADTEKKARELYEKAFGLDVVKPKHEKLKNDFTSLQGEYQGLTNDIAQVRTMVQNKDYEGFFQALGIPQQEVFQWVLEKAREQEMTPEQRAARQQQLQVRRDNTRFQQENENYRQAYEREVVNGREQQLHWVMQKPEVQQTMESLDTQYGAGTFRNEVIKRGMAHYQMTGQDLTPEQAVQEVMRLVGNQFGQPPQAAPTPAPFNQGAPVERKPPVIPHVSGRSASPTKKSIKSIDDIRRAYKDMSSAE